jgi:hypothetical protein
MRRKNKVFAGLAAFTAVGGTASTFATAAGASTESDQAAASAVTVEIIPPAGAKLVSTGGREGDHNHPVLSTGGAQSVDAAAGACDYRQWKWSPGVQLTNAGVRLASFRTDTVWSQAFCTLFTDPQHTRNSFSKDVTNNGAILGWNTPSDESNEEWFFNYNGIDHSAHHNKHFVTVSNKNPLVGDKHLGQDIDVYADGIGCQDVINGQDDRQCWQF